MATELVARLRAVEDRLERLIVSGWRNAAPEAADLAAEADALAESGLAELAARLRAVAAAENGAAALGAIALAATTSRLLRARLPAESPPGDWQHLVPRVRRPSSSSERLLPLGRMALHDGEAWACLRLRGGLAVDWLLLDPPSLPEPPAEPTPTPSLAARLLGRARKPEPDSAASPWLRRLLRGPLRWLARYPLGASGEVRRCAIVHPEWPEPSEDDQALTALARVLSRDSLHDDYPVLGPSLRLKQLNPDDTETYVWPDPVTTAAFRSAAHGPTWALAWTHSGLITPLVLLNRGSLLTTPHLIHLIPAPGVGPLR